jgi:carboxypeptidase C (cathepsin A)
MADADKKPDEEKEAPARPERSVSRPQTTTIDGQQLAYTATAGTLNLKDDKGEDRASVFYVAYTLDGGDPSRPLTFCFNGGPGSSSVWLQYGAFGPRRVPMTDPEHAPPPPYALEDNPLGLLDITDMVYIDPVGTGFSRAVGEAEDKDFHGLKEDVESVGEFIWRWMSRNNRWNAPVFLAGESYGTTRAAGLSLHLKEKGVYCAGLVLLSLATDFATFLFETGNDLPNVCYLPSYAAVAWYHDRLPDRPDALAPFLDEVRRFAIEEYAPALLQGDRLDPARRDALAARLARYTGLDADAIARRRLRIPYLWFARQLLGPGHRTVGRLDARFVGPDLDPYAQTMNRDPSYDAALGAYTSVVNDYLRRELGWETDDPYHVLSGAVNRAWKWERDGRRGFVSTAEDLRQAMVSNPHLRVLIANGLYDLATPFFAAEHTASHLGLPPELQSQVRLTWYEAGHMMYFHRPSHRQLRDDVVAFYADALRRPGSE